MIAKWRPATVLESVSDKSYLVKNDADIIRSNRVDLQNIPLRSPKDQAPVMEARSPRELQQRTRGLNEMPHYQSLQSPGSCK